MVPPTPCHSCENQKSPAWIPFTIIPRAPSQRLIRITAFLPPQQGFQEAERDAKPGPLPSAGVRGGGGQSGGAGPEKPAQSYSDRASLPRGWRLQQPSLHRHFTQDFLHIKRSFALISFSGTTACAFQDKLGSWLLPPGSSPRTSGRVGRSLRRSAPSPGSQAPLDVAPLPVGIIGSTLKKLSGQDPTPDQLSLNLWQQGSDIGVFFFLLF